MFYRNIYIWAMKNHRLTVETSQHKRFYIKYGEE